METRKKEELIQKFRFKDIGDDEFEVLEWKHFEKHGTAEFSAVIHLERPKGEEVWSLGRVDTSGYPVIRSLEEALALIQRVNL